MTIITLALAEDSGKYTSNAIQTKATPQGNDYVINGRKLFVTDAGTADYLICAASTGKGVTLYLVEKDTSGITCTPLKTISGDKQSEVTFSNVKVSGDSILGEIDKGWSYLEKVLQKANVARCAEMVGLR